MLKYMLSEVYDGYSFIYENDTSDDGGYCRMMRARRGSAEEIRLALFTLAKVLSNYYKKKVIILIDEYDVPLEKAYSNGYYTQMLNVIRGMLSALKDNPYIEKSILTGCLRISKESIFTGLNNLSTYTITDSQFSDTFGFTETEVMELLSLTGLENHIDEIRKWYDGYIIGKQNIYTPWDVLRYTDALLDNPSSTPKNYWANSSSNEMLNTMFDKFTPTIQDECSALINGKTISVPITEELTYADVYSKEEHIWSLLLETGYLTLSCQYDPNRSAYLKIPNEEIRNLFVRVADSWFSQKVQRENRIPLFDALWSGDTEASSAIITEYLTRTISYFDYKESFYHAFLAGLLSSSDYIVRLNDESGKGRPDIMLLDQIKQQAVIIEIKRTHKRNKLKQTAETALKQISDKEYGKDLSGYLTVLRYGIAFYEKEAFVVSC